MALKTIPRIILVALVWLAITPTIPSVAEDRPPEKWPSVQLSAKEIHDYLLDNRWNLDPIEGIWNYSEQQILEKQGGETESVTFENIYQIAIVKQGLQSGTHFQAIIISSAFEDWNIPGRIKGMFTPTDQQSVYDARWFGGNYHVFNSLFVLGPDERMLNGAFQLENEKGRFVSRVTIRKTFPARYIHPDFKGAF